MKAFRVRTETVIDPFHRHPSRCLILNQELRRIQESVFDSLGIELEDVRSTDDVNDEGVVFFDHTFFTLNMIREFINTCRGETSILRLRKGSVTKRSMTETMDVVDRGESIEYQLFFTENGDFSNPAPVEITPDEETVSMPFPAHMVPGGGYELPLTTKILMQIEHWCNLWVCNIAAVLGRVQEFKSSSKIRLLKKILKARSVNQWKVCSKNVVIGRGCDIHPTAYLENAVIGNGVEIGAGAVVRMADVGRDVVIANQCNVLASSIGRGSQLRDGVCIQFSVLYPETFCATRFVNASIVGRKCFLGDGVSLTDFRFDGKGAKVKNDGDLVQTESIFLGPCIGDSVYLGSGVVVGPGRAVPSNVKLASGSDRVITNDRLEGDFLVIRDRERMRRKGG